MQPAPDEERVIRLIPVADLEPDPFQPRKEFRERSIRELAASIERHGLLQPLVVRPRQGPNSAGKYWIVAGERRYRAAKLLGLETLPCQIQPYANMAAAVIALVENVHREDLSEIEKAEALLRIKAATEKGWEEVAELVKLSHAYVRRLVGLVKLTEPVKEMVRRGEISARTALALKPLSAQRQLEMAQRVLDEGLTAEQVREQTQRTSADRPSRKAAPVPRELPVVDLPSEPQVGAEPSSAAPGTPSSPVARSLKNIIDQLEEFTDWLGGRTWSPSQLTPEQRELVERLYHTASQLQQQSAQIRRSLRREADEEKEGLFL